MVGGAWPFLVGGVICLVNSVNERDLGVLARRLYFTLFAFDLCMGSVQERDAIHVVDRVYTLSLLFKQSW